MRWLGIAFGLALGTWLALAPACGTMTACGPGSCDGCCRADGRCVRAPTNAEGATCGKGGAQCDDCAARGAACVDSACTVGDGGPMVPPGCGAASCEGCCSGVSTSSVCVSGNSVTNCGFGGGVCRTCAMGQACVAGACVTSDAGMVVGAPCGAAADCVAVGAGAECRQKTTPGASSYPGGFCTRSCEADDVCPGDSVCVEVTASYGEKDVLCWPRCSKERPCRQGYGCYPVGQGVSACWLSPLPAFDAGTVADKVGQPCAQDSQCQAPPDDGFCLQAKLPDGGPSGFTQGSCTAYCTTSASCSADGGAVCLDVGQNGLCFERCLQPSQVQSSCRSGYACRPSTNADGGATGDGFCFPRCDAPGRSCGAGTTCKPNGICE